MPIRLDSRFIPVADRESAVREAIAQAFVPVSIDFPLADGPVIRGAINDLGDLRLLSVRSNATKAERTPSLARDSTEPSIFLGMQVAGSSLIVQHDREAVLRPGELVLYESSQPYTLVDRGGISQVQIRIPVESLALPRDVLGRVLAVTLSPGHPVADLTATYFQRMASRPDLFGDPTSTTVSRPSIELVRALVTTHLDLSELDGGSMHATLRLRILEYARANLGDPNLSADQIATEHHISVRHLYNVLAEESIGLGAWIRQQRVVGARQDLGNPLSATLPIAAIARRWGFRDASSFGRLFREAYGMTPREYRREVFSPHS
ncbi:helix-turn-helix domain-containing protein [Pedococcus sp. KACC 23699]|uniref:Helix-turn-helix domain-containing protein n=1 Tax=Pedococcus sp. KACC 23699 TaxID=3149228 RepID=A0AAU7JVK8_9MICO